MTHAHTLHARTAAVMTAALLAAGCTGDDTTSSAATGLDALHGADEELFEGAIYVAELHPLNPRAQNALDPDARTPRGVARGKAYFRVVGGELRAVVEVSGAEPDDGAGFPDGLHAQHIHAADRCPPASADVNGDGFVDVLEGVPFYGPILVPLDGELDNTTSEIPTFPIATGAFGTYSYAASAILAALTEAVGEPLDLASRHVVVHGVDLATPLPASVQSLGGLPAQITLPVACGELRRAR